MPKTFSEHEKRKFYEDWSELITGDKNGIPYNPDDPVFGSAPEVELSKSFEFDGFSIVYQHGTYYAEYPDADGNPGRHALFSKRTKRPAFPYTFIVEGVKKEFTEQDFNRIKKVINLRPG